MTMGEYIRQQFEAGRRNSSGLPGKAFDAHVAGQQAARDAQEAERRENEIKAATAAHFASQAEPEMKPMGHFESY